MIFKFSLQKLLKVHCGSHFEIQDGGQWTFSFLIKTSFTPFQSAIVLRSLIAD